MKQKIRAYIIALAALSMAGSAAFFSVSGLSKLSSGAGIAIIIFASSLEFSKLVMASFLHKRWQSIHGFMKYFATISVVIMMLLTSVGIYGVLSSGYAKTSAEFQTSQNEIDLKEKEKESFKETITRIEDNIKNKQERFENLSSQRTGQESRLNNLYGEKSFSGAKRTEELIKGADGQIKNINFEIDSLNREIAFLEKKIYTNDSLVIVMKSKILQGEAAPLQYVAKMLDKPMDTVVNWFFLLIIFIFDPIAIMLIIAYNIEINKIKEENEIQKKQHEGEIFSQEIEEEAKEEEIEENNQEENLVSTLKMATIEPQEKIEDVVQEEAIVIDEVEEKNEPEIKVVDSKVDLKPDVNYITLLSVLYNEGEKQIGDLIMSYDDFIYKIKNQGIYPGFDVIKNFLETCVFHQIITVTHNNINGSYLMSYNDAINKMQQILKK